MATCARRGCSQPLPQIAIRELDPYCSNACCRIAFGVDPMPEPPARTCKRCGVKVDELTPGCKACAARHGSRTKVAA